MSDLLGPGTTMWPATPGSSAPAAPTQPMMATAAAPAAPVATNTAPAPQPAAPPTSGPEGATSSSPNLLGGIVTTYDVTSPTGGLAVQGDPMGPAPDITSGVGSSANDLLPGGFSQSQLGVAPQSTATPDQSSYTQEAESEMQGPTNWNVTPDQTVQGQYAQLMTAGNPAIQAAEQATIRANAAHGGNNDLMAQTSAAMSGSQVALQIASQDAQTYAQAGQYNAQAANAYSQQLNAFVQNSMLSKQSFDQGIATLNAQTNQQLQLITANINASAASASIQLNAQLAQLQAQTNATFAQMDKTFSQNEAQALFGESIQQQEAWSNYGMQVRLGYLSNVSSQYASLQQALAAIYSNPNINASQAASAAASAVNSTEAFINSLGAYAAAMIPSPTTGGPNGTYTTPASNYSQYPAGFPNTGLGSTPAVIPPGLALGPTPATPPTHPTTPTPTPASHPTTPAGPPSTGAGDGGGGGGMPSNYPDPGDRYSPAQGTDRL